MTAAIEDAARSVPGVKASWAGSTSDGLTVFVVPDDPPEDESESQSVKTELWGRIFDDAYGRAPPADDPKFNAAGFESSFSSAAMAREELEPVVEGVSARVLAFRPRRVLEIGCGTGMLLFRIAPECERYVGLDISPRALAHIDENLGPLRPRVELARASALDLLDYEAGSFDLVLVNETVQYFPGVDYLRAVLRRAERILAPGGHVILGDVRSRPLLPLLETALAVHRTTGQTTAGELRARIGKALQRQRELVIDPCIIHTLAGWLPRLSDVGVALHDADSSNELTQYRFNLCLSFDQPAAPTVESWAPWTDMDGLRLLLRAAADGRIGVRAVPNLRVADAAHAFRWLREASDDAVFEAPAADSLAGVSPQAIRDVAAELGWRAALAGTPGDEEGRFDAVFTRAEGADAAWVSGSRCAHAALTSLRQPGDFVLDAAHAKRRQSLIAAVHERTGAKVHVVAACPPDATTAEALVALLTGS